MKLDIKLSGKAAILLLLFSLLISSVSCGKRSADKDSVEKDRLEKNKESMEDAVKLYALKYGVSEFNLKYIFFDDNSSDKVPFHWLYYIIKTEDKVILIDSGVTKEYFLKRFNIDFYDPMISLRGMGIEAADVTDIIVTHSHFDHIGGIADYPNADVHMIKGEYEAFDKSPSITSVRDYLKDSPKLKLYEGDYSLTEGVDVKIVGGHTTFSTVVYLNLNGETVVLTGDEVYLDSNVTDQRPVGTYVNLKKNKQFLAELKNSGLRFFTFHSPNIITPGSNWMEIKAVLPQN